MPAHNGLTYRDSGVDIDAGDALVERIKPMAATTVRAGALAGLGGFGAVFDPRAAGYQDPLLVSATDGVGTKLLVANLVGKHDTVGIDLVAMCVNDLVVQGAEPVFFLDYFASGKLDVAAAAEVVSGVATGCRDAGCTLVGGETAELPGLYAAGDYDLAGFAVGMVERDDLLTGDTIVTGDVVIGLESSGLHANGFSLVRKIIDVGDFDYGDAAPFDPEVSLGRALLTPTRIYVHSCLTAMRRNLIKGAAHITGGGLLENIPRVLPDDLGVELIAGSWEQRPVFAWLQKQGGIADHEMLRTFNCGIGIVLVVASDQAEETARLLQSGSESAHIIGSVVDRKPGGAAVVMTKT